MSDKVLITDIEDRTGPAPDVVIEIFDPPMCCPGGLCGPAVDPALLDISEAILALKRRHGGRVRVERYLLSQQVAAFMQYPEVFQRLQKDGTAVLPLTVANGSVVKERSYPTLADLESYVQGARKDGAARAQGREGVEEA